MKYPFTKIFFKDIKKDIPNEKELPGEKNIPEEKEVPKDSPKASESSPKVPETPPEEKEIPNTPPEVPEDSHDKKKVSCGYATKSEDRPQKPYQSWWINQMEVAKNMYPDCNQDQLDQIVMNWWDKHSATMKNSIWSRYDRAQDWIKNSKIKKESVV